MVGLGSVFLVLTSFDASSFANEGDDGDFPLEHEELEPWVDDDGESNEPPSPEPDEISDQHVGDRDLHWQTLAPPQFTLPQLPDGTSWTVEVVVKNAVFRSEALFEALGSIHSETLFTYTPGADVLAAAANRHVSVQVRALHRDTQGQVLGLYPLNLLAMGVDAHGTHWQDSGSIQFNASSFLDRIAIHTDLAPPSGMLADSISPLSDDPAISIDVCVDILTSFHDFQPRTSDGWAGLGREDFFFDTSPKRARGLAIVFESDGFIAEGGNSKHVVFTHLNWAESQPVGGVGPGCTIVQLVPGEIYRARAGSFLNIDSIELDIVEKRSHPAIATADLIDLTAALGSTGQTEFVYSPGVSSTSLSLRVDSQHVAWNMAAVWGFSLYRKRLDTIDTITAYWNDRPLLKDCNACSDRNKIFIKDRTLHRRRFAMIHELGHVMGYFADGERRPNFSYNAEETGNCPGKLSSTVTHLMNHEEFASAAAIEGLANYYVATVLNRNVNERDCWVVNNEIDFNNDDRLGLAGETLLPHSCGNSQPYGASSGLEPRLDGTNWWAIDYMLQECNSAGPPDRATQFDWTRFLWELDTDRNLSFTRIMRFWNAMDPRNWDRNEANGPGDPDKVGNRIDVGAAAVNRPNISWVAGRHGVDR